MKSGKRPNRMPGELKRFCAGSYSARRRALALLLRRKRSEHDGLPLTDAQRLEARQDAAGWICAAWSSDAINEAAALVLISWVDRWKR